MPLKGSHSNEELGKQARQVLVADDDAPTRILLRTAIAQWGYEAIEACDGEEAWSLLQNKNSPKLLIIDWLMPKIDGIQLCKKIRAELDVHPYIILLTQNAGTSNIVTGLEAGANEFLAKPFNMVELRSRLAVGAKIIGYENILALGIKENEKLSKISGLICQRLEKGIDQLTEISEHVNTEIPSAKKFVTLLNEAKSYFLEIKKMLNDNQSEK